MIQIRKITYILLIFVSTFYSCDKSRIFPIDGINGKNIDFSCGNVSIKFMKSLGPGYIINHQFNLTDEVTLYFDSLKIYHKEIQLEYEPTKEFGEKVNEKIFNLSGKRMINLHIPFPRTQMKGDTLLVSVKGFMVCNGVSVYSETLKIILP